MSPQGLARACHQQLSLGAEPKRVPRHASPRARRSAMYVRISASGSRVSGRPGTARIRQRSWAPSGIGQPSSFAVSRITHRASSPLTHPDSIRRTKYWSSMSASDMSLRLPAFVSMQLVTNCGTRCMQCCQRSKVRVACSQGCRDGLCIPPPGILVCAPGTAAKYCKHGKSKGICAYASSSSTDRKMVY